MQQKKLKVEIMAPAGSFASLRAAINAGADSIYFGVEHLNMRSRSSYNFAIEEISEIRKITKKAGIKAYLTLNTLLYDHDLKLMHEILSEAKKCRIDAVIVADMAAMLKVRELGLSCHASTQLSISNYEAVKFYAQFADTVVLAREVDLKMMKSISEKIKKENLRGPKGELLRLEVFVHGALCIAQSGRCQMSLLQTNTSAQRGACLQECRKKYRIIDDETGLELMVDNQYILSPSDLCTITFLDKLVDAGVSVFKIEGRGRSPDYVDTVTRIYKEASLAIDQGKYHKKNIDKWLSDLKKVYNRGFCSGYYLGKNLPDWSKAYGSKAERERVFLGIITHYFSKKKVAELLLQAHPLNMGDEIVIIGNTTGVEYLKVREIMLNDKMVKTVNPSALITIPSEKKVRKGDKVYLLKEREINEKT